MWTYPGLTSGCRRARRKNPEIIPAPTAEHTLALPASPHGRARECLLLETERERFLFDWDFAETISLLQGALDDALRRTLVEPKAFLWNVQARLDAIGFD